MLRGFHHVIHVRKRDRIELKAATCWTGILDSSSNNNHKIFVTAKHDKLNIKIHAIINVFCTWYDTNEYESMLTIFINFFARKKNDDYTLKTRVSEVPGDTSMSKWFTKKVRCNSLATMHSADNTTIRFRKVKYVFFFFGSWLRDQKIFWKYLPTHNYVYVYFFPNSSSTYSVCFYRIWYLKKFDCNLWQNK